MCALLIGISVTGCALVDAEKNNRGGFLDEIADDLWMKADSKKMRALRAITLEASLARIAMIAPKSASDRSLLARRIGETTKRADVVRRCAFHELQVSGQLSSEPCFFFDSVMVDYENALFDLALIALPIDEAKTLITRVTGGIASATVNPLELVQTLLNIGREAFRYGRVVGAIYRDTLELEVQVWLASPRQMRGSAGQLIVTDETVAGLAAVYVRGNDNIPTWRAEIAALRVQGLEPIPDPRFFSQLYTIIAYICGQIVSKEDPAYKECAQPDLTQKIPLMNASAGGGLVLSGIGGGGDPRSGNGVLNQQVRDQAQQQQKISKKLDDIEERQKAQERLQRRLAIGQTEQNITGPTLIAYKQAICVTGNDATTDVYDAQTRERLREFASGIEWAPAITPNSVVIGTKLVESLDKAVNISPSCVIATSVAKNAYEAGIYARSGVQAADTEMQNALKFLKRSDSGVNDTLRGRDAISALRKKFQPQATNGVRIDPPLWEFVGKNSRCNALAQFPVLPGGGRVQSDCPG
jgi:hypothetical protein